MISGVCKFSSRMAMRCRCIMSRWQAGGELARRCGVCIVLATSLAARGEEVVTSYSPEIRGPSDQAEKALAKIRVPEGFEVRLFAAEPMLANPVAFCTDERGRVFVAETFRHHAGVTDNRIHMYWLEDDLACRTVADRVEMFRKHLKEGFAAYGTEHDRVRLLEDTDGDGQADRSTVFADGFRQVPDGIGAGLLARRGDVYFTCIPDLWLLRDEDGDGQAEKRRSLQTGYGVHVAFLGHDLHGLRVGPDGRLYFSIGDRGFHVENNGRTWSYPDMGAVLRCNLDGSGLEVFHAGLRNPQELAFDEFGNLFTGDNNSDGGDQARWVYVVDGGDSGWRMYYQYLTKPVLRGPWNAERLWEPCHAEQPAYLVPPLANVGSGPSGLTYAPGTGLPAEYRRHFFMCDFRGVSSLSGIRTFRVEPQGASFSVVDFKPFVQSLLATDADFGPDGALYVTDWVEGWDKPKRGRVYKVMPKGLADDVQVAEVRRLLAEGFRERSLEELQTLLGHADMRVRQEAQFALVEQGDVGHPVLVKAAQSHPERLARLHAIWGLGQWGRRSVERLATVIPLLDDIDEEVRAQAARVLGDAQAHGAVDRLVARTQDASARVQFLAIEALGRIGAPQAVEAALALLRANADADPYLRHAAVMALSRTAREEQLQRAAADEAVAVRRGALLAMRRRALPEIARFLQDAEPSLVLEAARAIHDVPIPAALPALAERLSGPAEAGLLHRALSASVQRGGAESAARIAAFAAHSGVDDALRVEALEALAQWSSPPRLNRVLGNWQPLAERDPAEAQQAVKPHAAALLASSSPALLREAVSLVGALRLSATAPRLAEIAAEQTLPGEVRAQALRALEEVHEPAILDRVRAAASDSDAQVRLAALEILARHDPPAAVAGLDHELQGDALPQRQTALAVLAKIDGPAGDALLATWLDRWQAGELPAELELDLREAAAARSAPELQLRLARVLGARAKDDPLAGYRETLLGGNADRGREVFLEKTAVACLRCHRVNMKGGEVGPDLSVIGGKQTREYLLEAIVLPSRQIAKGFETVVLQTDDGQTHVGVLRSEDDEFVRLITPEGTLLAVPKTQIEERASGASAMPEKLVEQLTPRELRDLIEYLATRK